jgi:hypothetical protein
MSLSNPTGKDSLRVHAARLREMIEDLACFGLDADGAAALLAGAEALENLEVARAALLKVRDHARPTHREDAYEVCYDWCPLCAVTAALARLEGK